MLRINNTRIKVAADAVSNSNVLTDEQRVGLLHCTSNKDDNTKIIGTNQYNIEYLYNMRWFSMSHIVNNTFT